MLQIHSFLQSIISENEESVLSSSNVLDPFVAFQCEPVNIDPGEQTTIN
jgi:hypothetical protein